MTKRAPSSRHPLDPLTKDELITTTNILKASGKLLPDSRFATIYLKESPKDDVLFAVVYHWSTGIISEAVVDLVEKELKSWKDLEPNDPPCAW